MFPSQTYSLRRSELIKKTGTGIILIPGNSDSPMNYPANTFPFRQDSHFLYFCGIDLPGLFLVLDCDSGESVLFGDENSIEDIVWTGPLPTLASQATASGISKIHPSASLKTFVDSQHASGRNIHFTPPYRGENQVLLSALLGISPGELKSKASLTLIQSIVDLRSFKTDEEILEIEKAVNLTGAMHLAAMKFAKPGMIESEVVAKLMYEVHAAECLTSFPVILSVNGQVLHNHHHKNKLENGKLLLVDAGGESKMHYAGDMTRTFPVSGKFSTQQNEIYSIVLAAQEAAIAALQPGKTYKEIHLIASLTIAEGLKSVGLMQGNMQDAVNEGAHALFFPHGLGHMMGLDVHDMEDLGENHIGYSGEMERSTQFGLAYLRLAKKLQSGFVFTVEPGIYFIPELAAIWKNENKHSSFINYSKFEEYKNFGGIRIEEDFLITENGFRLLGKPIPKSIAGVEAIREEAIKG